MIGAPGGLYTCLIRFRSLMPVTSGCITLEYLDTSQKRFWQSISCSRLPHSERNVSPRRSNSYS